MSEPETRSVGELIRDADILSRQILFDVGPADGPGMVRTWGEVVEAAAELWCAVPAFGRTDEVDLPMDRLVTLTEDMHRARLRTGWPGAGPADESLTRIRDAYLAATDLVRRNGQHIRPGQTPEQDVPAVRSDVVAARAHIMHTLYVASHGVAVAVKAHRNSLQRDPEDKSSFFAAWEAFDRMTVLEHVAGSYAALGHPSAYDGEHVPPPHGLERLEYAVARWDLQAHRTLAASPTPPNLSLIARVQAEAGAAMHRVVDAGLRFAMIDMAKGFARLSPALEESPVAWHRAAGRWAELAAPGRMADKDVVLAAGEIRTALREICHDKAGWASPDRMAERVSLGGVVQALQQTLTTGVDLAYSSRAVAATAPLEGRARAISQRYNDLPGVDARRALVTLRDIQADRMMRMPEALRPGLVATMNEVVTSAIDAVSAAAWLDQTTDTIRDPTSLTRHQALGIQERLPMDYRPGGPASRSVSR